MTVDEYIEKHPDKEEMLNPLRELILEFPFAETIKWGMPTYVYGKRNLVGIGAFKNHIGLWFFQGSLLSDPADQLRNAQEGKTKAMRQIHFEKKSDINESVLRGFLKQTIENEDRGLYVKIERNKEPVKIPDELAVALKNDTAAGNAFKNLTLSKQREYADHISSAKQAKTKERRLEKILPMITEGKGLHDAYKNC